MKGTLNLTESVSIPRAQYDALVNIATTLLWTSESIAKVNFPGAHGYLMSASHWEFMITALESLVEPLSMPAVEDSEEQAS